MESAGSHDSSVKRSRIIWMLGGAIAGAVIAVGALKWTEIDHWSIWRAELAMEGWAGSALGLVGVFAALALTIRHENARDRRAAARAAAMERRRAIELAVSDAVVTLANFEHTTSIAPSAAALFRLSAAAAEDEPEFAEWAKSVGLDIGKDRRPETRGYVSGTLTVGLFEWLKKRLTSDQLQSLWAHAQARILADDHVEATESGDSAAAAEAGERDAREDLPHI